MMMASRKRKSKILSGKLMNIPELKESFSIIDTKTHELLKEGLDEKELIKQFQALWKSVFHRSVTPEAAKAFLEVKRASKGKKGTRKNKASNLKQSGGFAPLAGAPLDYTTRPGVDGVHGSFPAYVASGQDSYNKFNQIGLDASCGKVDITPVVPRSIGSNDVV
jgi:hypothetical protein